MFTAIHTSSPIAVFRLGLSVSHSMGMATPDEVEHRLSMHFSLVDQRQPGHNYWRQSSLIHHIFLDVSRPLVPGIRTSVTDFTQDLAYCICPHHMNRRLRWTGVISPMPSFCNRKLRVLHTNDDWHTPSAREGIPIIFLPVFVQTPVIRNWWELIRPEFLLLWLG